MSVFNLPIEMVGLRLARINRKDELILCEAVRFDEGVSAVDTILRRAAISGRVEVEGEIENYFADALDADGNMVTTIALDSRSYSALKNRWMRCRVERFEWMTTDQKPEIDSRIHPPSDPSADFAAAGEEVSYSEWAKAEARICHMIRETEPLEKIKEFDDFLWRYVVNTASTLDKAHAVGWDAAIEALRKLLPEASIAEQPPVQDGNGSISPILAEAAPIVPVANYAVREIIAYLFAHRPAARQPKGD